MRNRDRMALVTPWFGAEAIGGAQLLANQLSAELFAPAGGVDVLTTCNRSFHDDWSRNHYEEGIERGGDVTVRRFAVGERDADAFQRANEFLLGQPREWFKKHARAIPPAVAAAFARENITSPGLLQYLKDWGPRYHAVIFTPYLYGPILNGVALLPNAFLQPCLHDEGYAYLPKVGEIFHAARGLLFNSRAEYELARRLYGRAIASKSTIVGHWVDDPLPPARIGHRISRERFVLYIGRADPAKNVKMLLQSFSDYRRYGGGSLQLVIAGRGTDAIPAGGGVIALGEVDDERKRKLLTACVALVQPSSSESFSRSVMEAWSYGKPVAVNAACPATAAAVAECAGGWSPSTRSEWAAVFAAIDRAPQDLLQKLGSLGREYYRKNGTPARVLARYRVALGLETPPAALLAVQS